MSHDFVNRVVLKAQMEGKDPIQALNEMLALLTQESVLYQELILLIEEEAKEIQNYILKKVLFNYG